MPGTAIIGPIIAVPSSRASSASSIVTSEVRATPPAPEGTRAPGLRELFFGFMKVGVSGFGGVLAWAHRMIVAERRWLSEQEFVEILGLCQIMPGPNIAN